MNDKFAGFIGKSVVINYNNSMLQSLGILKGANAFGLFVEVTQDSNFPTKQRKLTFIPWAAIQGVVLS